MRDLESLLNGDIAQAAAEASEVPDLATLRRRGSRRRTLRHASVAGVAALTVVLVLVSVQMVGGARTSAPDPATPSPSRSTSTPDTDRVGPLAVQDLDVGPRPRVAYHRNHALHVGDSSFPITPVSRFASGGATAVAESRDGGSRVVDAVVDGDLVRLPAENLQWGSATVSPDGSLVVWAERRTPTERVLVAWDPDTRAVIDTHPLPVRVTCCDAGGEVLILGIDGAGWVYGQTRRRFAWSPSDGRFLDLPLVGGVARVIAQGPVFQDDRRYPQEPGTVKAMVDGSLTKVGSLADRWAPVSPAGTRVAYVVDGSGTVQSPGKAGSAIRVERMDGTAATVFAFETGRFTSPIAWEDEEHVLIEVSAVAQDVPEYVVRCSVAADECEVALSGGEWRFSQD